MQNMNIANQDALPPHGEGMPQSGREGAFKWVTCWGNATSITDRKECVYAKDITLRYPIRIPFVGSQLRLRFSNLTGTEPVTLSRIVLAKADGTRVPLPSSITIAPGAEVNTDAVSIPVAAGEEIAVSIYLAECTQMNAGTLITGPLSKASYAYGDYADADEFPIDLTRKTQWFYFLNTIDILTDPKNHAVVCYGDSITAQSWPDYLALRAWREGYRNVAIIRRAVSGTRILRQYDCITYQAYGLKGATRFPVEMNVSGVSAVIIQHGINDIIHPVGSDVNPFRPWSDMPTLDDMCQGMEHIYVDYLRSQDYINAHGGAAPKIYCGTLLPIYGWRTYNEDRDLFRQQFNEWMRQSPLFDGCIDFDLAVRNVNHPAAFAPGYDSGDHLHPSESAYEAMANAVPAELLG